MLGRSLLSCTYLHKKHTNMDKNVTDIGYYKSLVNIMLGRSLLSCTYFIFAQETHQYGQECYRYWSLEVSSLPLQ
jgi:hypothetical protein